MEKEQNFTLFKTHGYRSILSIGYRFYITFFRKLLKSSWQMVLIYAAAGGALLTQVSIKFPELSLAMEQQLATDQTLTWDIMRQWIITMATFIALVILAVITDILASGSILNKLKEHHDTGKITNPTSWWVATPKLMGRTLKGALITLPIILLPMLLWMISIIGIGKLNGTMLHNHPYSFITICFAGLIVIMGFSLPLMYVLMKYIMEAPVNYFHTLRHHYTTGLRHWGSMFLVFFVSILITKVCMLFVMLPTTILQLANNVAHTGLLMGDPLGMPSYIVPLTFCTGLLCCFFQFYISLIVLIHNYFLYGSIEAKEQEKQQLQQNIAL